MHKSLQINDAQSKAISHGTGPMLVLAGPGSGKTFVITQRILHLIETLHIKPEQILVITFTKAAALEMQKRFRELSQGQMYPVSFGTFHAIFFHILQQTHGFHASSILRDAEKHKYLREIIQSLSMSPNPTVEKNSTITLCQSNITLDSDDSPEIMQRILSEISKIKNMGLSPESYQSECCSPEEFLSIYQHYEKKVKLEHKVDFDDMVLLCLSLLKQRPDILKNWQNKYQYILIDEFQDINPPQYETVRLLAAPQNNLFVVGDDDQSIYGFRGSNPEIMLHFEEDYPDAKRILLNINYRSKKDIIKAAQNVIEQNGIRFTKDVTTFSQESNSVKLYHFPSQQIQRQNIISLIQQYITQSGAHYRDIALIYRTNTNAAITAEKLMQEKIPFQMKERTKCIYDTEIAKDIFAYLEYALYESSLSAFYRIMNRPVRYISRTVVPSSPFAKEELLHLVSNKEYVLHNVISLYEQLSFLRKLSPYAAVNYIRKGIGYENYILQKERAHGGHTTEMISLLNELQENAQEFEDINEWLEHIKHFKENIVQAQKPVSPEQDAVHIVTMHASKGLEWPVVVIPDLNEGIVPHKKAASINEIEEERRMFYVALTRAKQKLFLFYIKEEAGNLLPSRFIQELISKPYS